MTGAPNAPACSDTRWFTWPGLPLLAPLPMIAGAAWLVAWRGLWSARGEWLPFAASVVLFLASLIGIGINIRSAAIPGALTIWPGVSQPRTQIIVAGAQSSSYR